MTTEETIETLVQRIAALEERVAELESFPEALTSAFVAATERGADEKPPVG